MSKIQEKLRGTIRKKKYSVLILYKINIMIVQIAKKENNYGTLL